MKQEFQKFEDEAKSQGLKAKGKAQESYAGIFQQSGQPQNASFNNNNNEVFKADQIPPNWDMAANHRRAWKVGQRDPTGEAICPCCTRHVERIPLTINCNTKDLSFLGSGLPLYLDFIRACIVILLIFFVTSGDYNIITNYQYGRDCGTRSEDCPNITANSLSLANKRGDIKLVNIQQVLNLVSIVVLIIVLQFFRKSQRDLDGEIDTAFSYASDYSILVTKLPKTTDNLKNQDFDDDLMDFFTQTIDQYPLSADVQKNEIVRKEQTGQYYEPYPRIVSVNLGYRLNEQIDKQNEKAKLIIEKQKFLTDTYNSGKDPEDPSIQESDALIKIQQQIDQIDIQIVELERLFYEGKGVQDYFLGIGIVTFQWESDRNRFLKEIEISAWQKFLGKKSQILYRDTMINVDQPSEPTDIFWENLHLTNKQKTQRRALANALTILVLGVCTGAVYLITYLQHTSADSQKREQIENALAQGGNQEQQGDWITKIAVKLFSLVASITISLINAALATIILKLSEYNGYATQTQFNVSVASKSGFAQFLNTAIITFLISTLISKNIYGSGGLVETQTTVFLTNSIIPIISDLADAGGLYAKYAQWQEKKKGNKSVMTQQQANIRRMEKPAFVISARYGVLLRNMYVTAFYATMIPLSLVVSAFQLALFVWVEKFDIINRRTIKYNYGSELSYEMTEYLELVLPIYCATNFYWQYSFNGDVNVYAILGVVLGLLNALIPMQLVNEYIFPQQSMAVSALSYTDCEKDLMTDYARENPATRVKAREDFTKRRAAIKRTDDMIAQIGQKGAKSMF